jgi:hypothetical protein
MDRRALFDSVYKLAEPWFRDGFRFFALRRYVNASGADVYAKVLLHREQPSDDVVLHVVPVGNSYQLREQPPERLPPYLLEPILARGDEPVIFAPDEATADAALMGPGILVTTGTSDTDWTPLRARTVLIWAGADHGWLTDLANALLSAGVQVELCDADVPF